MARGRVRTEPEEELEPEITVGDEDLEEPPFDVERNVENGKITEITFKTNKNLGNQEHRSVEITSTVNEDVEDVEDVYNYLQETADYLLNG